ARAGARVVKERAVLAEEEPQRGAWATPLVEDPFAVSLERKLADLEGAIGVLRADRRVRSAEARMLWRRERKQLLSTEGTDVDQTLVCGGAGIKVVVAEGDEVVQRCWPMDYDGGIAGAGYEFVAQLDLPGNAARIREEAVELLSAPPCP